MSELKAGVIVTPHDEGMCFHQSSAVIAVTEGETEFYLKSEADKVIADLIEKNERLSDDCLIKASNTFREIEKEIRHHEYKRCLAMAEWCKSRSRYYELLIKIEASYLLSNPHNVHKYERKAFRSKYWYMKWLELAEKFKEGIQNGMR